MNSVVSTAQNWEAYLQLKLTQGEQKTRLVPLKRYGPLSVQRPFYPEQETCHVYLLHPPGGVVGGDRLELNVDVESNAKALLTTPGATKFYHSAGLYAQLKQQLKVQQHGELEFLPQENIYFPGALVQAKTSLQVNQYSHAIFWEKHCFGRPANNELFTSGKVITELEVIESGKLILTEKQRIDSAEIKRASGMRGYAVSGTLVIYSHRINKNLIELLKELVPEDGISGLTRPLDNILLVRFMGNRTTDINNYFIKLLALIRPVILQKEICYPRIWAT